MASDDWTETTLGAIALGQHGLVDGPFGSNLPASAYRPNGIPVIRGSNLSLGEARFFDNDFVFVSEDMAARLARSTCMPGDVVFTKKGTIGQTGFVPLGGRFERYLLSSNQMKLSVDPAKADGLFVYYVVSSPAGRDRIIRDASVTGVPKTNVIYLRSFPIRLPPLPEQHAIAHILGTLDDKIELNRKMNHTLETIARAIFKSWFMDFDPVRAKAHGRDPGLPKPLADLFPDSLVDSEFGKMPATWQIKPLGDLIDLVYGKALKEENRQPGPVAVYGSNGQVGWHDSKLASGPGIIVGRKGNPGVVMWAPTDFFAIDTTFYVVPKTECNSLYFLFYSLKDLGLASLGADSAVPGLNRNMAYMSKQLVPSAPVLDAFDERVRPLFNRIKNGDEQSVSLAGLRDTLLPKLISGELRVTETHRFVEAQSR